MAIDFSKPVQTRDGRKARILCTDAPGAYPIVALVGAEALTFTRNGHLLFCDESGEDLANVPEETVEFVNYYGHDDFNVSHPSVASAREGGTDPHGRFVPEALLKVTKVDGKITAVELL